MIHKAAFPAEVVAHKVANLTLLQNCNSPFISRPEAIFENEENVYIVTSLLRGLELQKLVIKSGRLAEEKARVIMRGLIRVLLEYKALGLLFTFP